MRTKSTQECHQKTRDYPIITPLKDRDAAVVLKGSLNEEKELSFSFFPFQKESVISLLPGFLSKDNRDDKAKHRLFVIDENNKLKKEKIKKETDKDICLPKNFQYAIYFKKTEGKTSIGKKLKKEIEKIREEHPNELHKAHLLRLITFLEKFKTDHNTQLVELSIFSPERDHLRVDCIKQEKGEGIYSNAAYKQALKLETKTDTFIEYIPLLSFWDEYKTSILKQAVTATGSITAFYIVASIAVQTYLSGYWPLLTGFILTHPLLAVPLFTFIISTLSVLLFTKLIANIQSQEKSLLMPINPASKEVVLSKSAATQDNINAVNNGTASLSNSTS